MINNQKIKLVKKDLVSVIIPFYNRFPELFDSIDSVLNQSYKNLELILVNDCSNDNVKIVEDFIKKDKRIKLYQTEQNSGPAAARNVGIKNALGKYIAFLDSDDQFLPNKITIQLELMKKKDSVISHTSYFRCGENRKQIIKSGLFRGNVIPKIIERCTIATPTIMIKKSFLTKNNLYFPNMMKIGEDVCFWMKILKKNELLGINLPLTCVNVNLNSASNDVNKQIEGLKNIIDFVKQDKELSVHKREINTLKEALNSYIFFTDNSKASNNQSDAFINQNNNTINQNNETNKVGFIHRTWRKIMPLSVRVKVKKLLNGCK